MIPYRIAIADADLDDLRTRLRRTRWPERETVADASQGVPLAYVQSLCRHWAEEYDWRATEARLNALPQFRTELDGLAIHFLHVRSPEPAAFPLVMTHGWPGSIVEFLDVLGPLTDPAAHGGLTGLLVLRAAARHGRGRGGRRARAGRRATPASTTGSWRSSARTSARARRR